MKKKVIIFLFIWGIIFSFYVGEAAAELEEESSFFLQTSLYTRHWRGRVAHNNDQELLGLEYYSDKSSLYGFSHFQNSADQDSWYFYRGSVYDFKEISDFKVYGKLTYGIITGYDDEDGEHTSVWFRIGTFPAAIPMLGLEYRSFAVEAGFFANQGIIVNAGIRF